MTDFTIYTPHTRLHQGDMVSVEYPDGKGVTARVAHVEIGPGGTPFAIICTHDGQVVPDPTGGTFRTTEGSTFRTGVSDDRPETVSDEADASPGGDYVSTVERADWAALREARLRRQERTISRMQTVERDLRDQLAEVRAELGAAKDEVLGLTEARHALLAYNEDQARTIRELREHSVARSDDQGITLPPGGRPGHLVMTWHESDGSVTIRVEDH